MAYLRGTDYVYESESGLNVNGHLLDPDAFDAVALMRVCELLADEKRFAAVHRLVERSGGNFGAEAALKLSGGPTAMDSLRLAITQAMPDRRAHYEVCETCGTFLRAKDAAGRG